MQPLQLAMLVGMFVVFYFLLIRPQQKKQKEIQATRNSLKKGDKIIMIGGMIGVIKKIKDDMLIIDIGNKDEVLVKANKWAVSTVITQSNDNVTEDLEEVEEVEETDELNQNQDLQDLDDNE